MQDAVVRKLRSQRKTFNEPSQARDDDDFTRSRRNVQNGLTLQRSLISETRKLHSLCFLLNSVKMPRESHASQALPQMRKDLHLLMAARNLFYFSPTSQPTVLTEILFPMRALSLSLFFFPHFNNLDTTGTQGCFAIPPMLHYLRTRFDMSMLSEESVLCCGQFVIKTDPFSGKPSPLSMIHTNVVHQSIVRSLRVEFHA